uniref:Uncharacterized protein n=1 Tax=Angiostrongylus cantonensis TaxID=6313 RepID=A0A0K0DKH5_ANGCA
MRSIVLRPKLPSEILVSSHEDVLVTFLVDVELQSMGGPGSRTSLPIGIQRIKPDPDMDISSLFSNRFAYEEEAYEASLPLRR